MSRGIYINSDRSVHIPNWIIWLIIIGLCFYGYQHRDTFMPVIKDYWDVAKSKVGAFFERTAITNCPQIDVPIEEMSWGELRLKDKKYDGWTIKGDATCRKGKQEGENRNYYYCGGYSSMFGIGFVNTYIQKTIISEDGNIGKTYKYVIWNEYDENKEFIQTKCLGDPDEFERKQAEALEREMLKWR